MTDSNDSTAARDDKLIAAAALAERWGICRAEVYKLLHQGLPSVKIGRARRFRPSDVEAWLEAQQSLSHDEEPHR